VLDHIRTQLIAHGIWLPVGTSQQVLKPIRVAGTIM
jgi:hypothetical protein